MNVRDCMLEFLKSSAVLKILLALCSIVVLILLGLTALYFNLDVGETPQTSDVIIVPEGARDRSYKASQLLNEGYSTSNQIIASPATDPQGFDARPAYYSSGVEDDQLINEDQASSTWTNATNTIDIMEEEGWDSAIIVTSDYHMRRTRLAFERASKDLDMDFTYVSSYRNNDGEKVTYHDNSNGRFQARREVWKYIGYFLGLYNLIDVG